MGGEGASERDGSPSLYGAHSPVTSLLSGYQAPSKASASSCFWEMSGIQGRQEGTCRILTPSPHSGWAGMGEGIPRSSCVSAFCPSPAERLLVSL